MINRIETKTQYIHRYRGRHDNWSDTGSYSQTQVHSIQKPLQGGAYAQVSFKGFDFSGVKKTFSPYVKKIPKRLTQKVFSSIKHVSDEQFTYYSKVRDEYVNLVKNSKEFRERFGFSEEAAKNISSDNLFFRPRKRMFNRFIDNVFAPFRALGRGVKKLFSSKNSPENEKLKKYDKVMKEFGSLEGLINSHEIWENGYRQMSGHGKWSATSEFLIPDDVLYSKIKRRRNKVVDPDKGKYSTTSLMLGNRFISGTIYAYFLGNDAYNTTMRYSNDKNEAAGQRKSRVAQEFSRIGLNMYIQNLLFGTFETAVNKSLPTALLVSGSTVAFSEILGRKLVGKPIMPSDKETLDRLEKEMDEKKGVLPAIGRLLTRAKKPAAAKPSPSEAPKILVNDTKKANTKAFAQFSKKHEPKNSTPSFKGYYSVAKTFEKKRLNEILKIIKHADLKQFEHMKENIVKSVKKSQILTDLLKTAKTDEAANLKFIKEANLNSADDINKAFEHIMKSSSLKEIPLGTQKTFWGQVTKSVLVPVHFIKDVGISIKNGTVKLFNRITGKHSTAKLEQMNKMLQNPAFKEAENFNAFYKKRLELPAWKNSELSSDEKKVRIFGEYMGMLSKQPEEIEGMKNILMWLDKQITKSEIKIKPDGTLSSEDLKKVQNLMKESVMRADGAKHVEYDGNKLSQTNINLARAITTIFLVTDAYNLTMQYSNDNKKDANKSAKNRAAQEISRISFSAYILAFVHNLLSKLCNSSLAGAFGLTAMTSVINDSISRKVVGVPLTAKTKEQLEEIEEKNANSKSPIKKALARSWGKKASAGKVQADKHIGAGLEDFYITPTIS